MHTAVDGGSPAKVRGYSGVRWPLLGSRDQEQVDVQRGRLSRERNFQPRGSIGLVSHLLCTLAAPAIDTLDLEMTEVFRRSEHSHLGINVRHAAHQVPLGPVPAAASRMAVMGRPPNR